MHHTRPKKHTLITSYLSKLRICLNEYTSLPLAGKFSHHFEDCLKEFGISYI
jgi:hypothetical protein